MSRDYVAKDEDLRDIEDSLRIIVAELNKAIEMVEESETGTLLERLKAAKERAEIELSAIKTQ